MDAGYKTPWIAKKALDDGKVPILPYTRYTGNKDRYKPWEYTYDPANDTYICPCGGILRHTTTDRDGKRTYEVHRRSAEIALAKENVVRMKKGKRYTPHISGRRIWIWWSRYAKRSVRRKFMRSAKKPLNGSLCRRERETRDALYTPQRLGRRHTMGQA